MGARQAYKVVPLASRSLHSRLVLEEVVVVEVVGVVVVAKMAEPVTVVEVEITMEVVVVFQEQEVVAPEAQAAQVLVVVVVGVEDSPHQVVLVLVQPVVLVVLDRVVQGIMTLPSDSLERQLLWNPSKHQ